MAKRHAFLLVLMFVAGLLIPQPWSRRAADWHVVGNGQGPERRRPARCDRERHISRRYRGPVRPSRDANGVYNIPGLPPGSYTVRFELQGMAPLVHEAAVVPLGGVGVIDATMALADADRSRQRDGAGQQRHSLADWPDQLHVA